MKNEEILRALRRSMVQTGSLVCLGCGYEHSCSVHGCRIMREAAGLIEKMTDRCAQYVEEIAVLQERLTKRCNGVVTYIGASNGYETGQIACEVSPQGVRELLERVAAYEDTGLTPEQCVNAKAIVESAFSDDTSKAERIRELLKADRDGRAVVLPVRPVLKPETSNTLYMIEDGKIYEDWICEVEVGMSESGETNAIYMTLDAQMSFEQADIGKTVFCTREEAEKALEGKESVDEFT